VWITAAMSTAGTARESSTRAMVRERSSAASPGTPRRTPNATTNPPMNAAKAANSIQSAT